MKVKKPIQLSEHIVQIAVNANLIFSEKQGILIDTSFSVENLKLILRTFKELNIEKLIVLNTHKHYHHAANNNLLLTTFPNAKIYTSQKQYIHNGTNVNKLKFILDESQSLFLDNLNVTVRVVHSGGHTVDHTMYLVNDNKKIFFTGDILHTISQLDSSIGPIPHIEHPSIGLLEQYLRAIEIIKKERPDIICGHTCVGTSGESVYMTVRKTEEVLKRLEELVKEHWRNYLSEEEMARRIFIDLCGELHYNPNLRFSEKLGNGKTVYEVYDLPLLLTFIKKYKWLMKS